MGKIYNDTEPVSEDSSFSAVLASEGLHIRLHSRRICTSGEYFLVFLLP